MANSKEPEKKEMGPMEKLLGAEEGFSIIKEMKEEGEHEMVEVSKAFGSDLKLLGLYFSMHNCPPCREFTPLLAEIYREVNEDTKQLEIIFLSGDKTPEMMKEYYVGDEMPWLAMPHKDPRFKQCVKKYGVKGLPRLVMLRFKDGEILE